MVFKAGLILGHHPTIWKQAMVMVIPKPGKANYTCMKAHHPISLLKTMRKLLEKIIAK